MAQPWDYDSAIVHGQLTDTLKDAVRPLHLGQEGPGLRSGKPQKPQSLVGQIDKGPNDGDRFAACWISGDQSWPIRAYLWRRKEEGQHEGGWLGLYTVCGHCGGGSSHPGIPAERTGPTSPAPPGDQQGQAREKDRIRTSHCCLSFGAGISKGFIG